MQIGCKLVLFINRNYIEVAYGLSIDTKIGDLERHNGGSFALSHYAYAFMFCSPIRVS